MVPSSREPHVYVPLVSRMWPHVPKVWIDDWAWIGRRNEYQVGRSWREVSSLNRAYIKTGLSYRGRRSLADLAKRTRNKVGWADALYAKHAVGGAPGSGACPR